MGFPGFPRAACGVRYPKIRYVQCSAHKLKTIQQGPRRPANIIQHHQDLPPKIPPRYSFWGDIKSRMKNGLAISLEEEARYQKAQSLREKFLKMLADLNLKCLSVNAYADEQLSQLMTEMEGSDSVFQLSEHLYLDVLCYESLHGSSLNTRPISSYAMLSEDLDDHPLNSRDDPLESLIFDRHIRTITMDCYCSSQKTFNCLVLGRLKHKEVPTYWVVVLDEFKQLWALRADVVDDEEKYYGSHLEWDEGLDFFPMREHDLPTTYHRKRQLSLLDVNIKDANFKHRVHLFGGHSPVVYLGPLKLLSPRGGPIKDFPAKELWWVESWISRWTVVPRDKSTAGDAAVQEKN